jgi:ATP-dependent helicase HepA
VFHEDLPSSRRDLEVARFREPEGPSLLVSTECGGEGRNFEFCRRLVLFDLPWKPATVEQRIGRLDRIGRRVPVEIVYFQPPDGLARDVVRLHDAIGLFREPTAGLDPQLGRVEAAIEEVAADVAASLTAEGVDALLSDARAARTRIRDAAYQQLHHDPYLASMADGILSRVPSGLDALNEQVVTTACARLGFAVERTRGRRGYSIEFGAGALVDSLPGVSAGSTWVGSFDREEAVDDESLDFFASGHALVEGVFAHFDDSPLGRVARFRIEAETPPGEGLAAIYKDGPRFEVVALDAAGRRRPEWEAMLRRRPLGARRAHDRAGDTRWQELVRALGRRLDPARRPHAVAAIEVRPAGA